VCEAAYGVTLKIRTVFPKSSGIFSLPFFKTLSNCLTFLRATNDLSNSYWFKAFRKPLVLSQKGFPKAASSHMNERSGFWKKCVVINCQPTAAFRTSVLMQHCSYQVFWKPFHNDTRVFGEKK
jgi:hypothetical protein